MMVCGKRQNGEFSNLKTLCEGSEGLESERRATNLHAL
jgi:hypothetical protein